VDDDENNTRRSGVPLARRAVRDCRAKEEEEEEEEEEELPIDPSRLFGAGDDAAGSSSGCIASISSAVTREGCIDLARRLGRIESGLLEAAGESTRSDAFRALAKAARRQAKRADSLGRKACRQERKIDVLEALCEKLMTTIRENATLRSSMRAEMDALGRENARLVEKLRTSEAYNAGMNARAKEMSERLRRMEGENVRVSRLLLDSYSSSANHDDDGDPPRGRSGEETTDPRRSEFDEPPRDEYSRRRAEGDRAEIDRLGSEMARMIELHARREGRSERKVALLMEIKSAMEKQIRFLEGGGEDEDDVSVR
jgi:chromosome segregation ATPase